MDILDPSCKNPRAEIEEPDLTTYLTDTELPKFE
jgi:hypothetical protein